MGGWQLEVGKMALYMAFPVGMFHYFNQPEYFEKWVTEQKRLMYPPESKSHRSEIEQTIRDIREKNENKMMKELEEMEQKKLARNV